MTLIPRRTDRRTPPGRRDRGAVASIVALFFGGMVILGSAALAIDWGSVMWERRQLQNGSDAAAVAMGVVCAQNPAACKPATMVDSSAGISALNNVNADKDQRNGYSVYPNGICARAFNGTSLIPGLPPCVESSTPTLAQCPPVNANLAAYPQIPYIEVHSATAESGGGSLLPPFVAQTLGYGGTTVKSCTRVFWMSSPASGGGGIPLTISACVWQEAGGNINGSGAGAYAPPPYDSGNPQPPASAEETILLQSPNGGNNGNGNGNNGGPPTCPNWQGHTQPGGFGSLETAAGNACEVRTFPQEHWYHVSTGNQTACNLSQFIGKVVKIPVFDCATSSIPVNGVVPSSCAYTGSQSDPQGNNVYYHAQGYGYFYLTGFHYTTSGGSANQVNSIVTGRNCAGNNGNGGGGERCLMGWFVTHASSGGPPTFPPSGNNSFGNKSVFFGG